MAGKNDNFDALMAMMALKHIMDDTKDIEIHPFTCEVTVTPTSISCLEIIYRFQNRKNINGFSNTFNNLINRLVCHRCLIYGFL